MDSSHQNMHTNRAEAAELIEWWRTWEKYQADEKRQHDSTQKTNNTTTKTIKRARGE